VEPIAHFSMVCLRPRTRPVVFIRWRSQAWIGFWSGLMWSGPGAGIDPERSGTFMNSR
jgi:hypothetical protein